MHELTVTGATWTNVLDDMGMLGASDQKYQLPARPDTELWSRAISIHQASTRHHDKQAVQLAPDAAIMAELRRVYQTGAGRPRIPLDVVAARLRAIGHSSAFVDTAAGSAAILCVGPRWRDRNDDDRYAATAGPGTFHAPGWQDPRADPEDFHVSRDEDESSADGQVPADASLEDIVDLIDRQVKKSIAITRAAEAQRAALHQRRQAVTWGHRLSDDQCDALQDWAQPNLAGGDAELGGAVFLYELDEPLDTSAGTIPAGTYLRTVEDKTVQAFAVTGDARDYVRAVEDELLMDHPNYY